AATPVPFCKIPHRRRAEPRTARVRASQAQRNPHACGFRERAGEPGARRCTRDAGICPPDANLTPGTQTSPLVGNSDGRQARAVASAAATRDGILQAGARRGFVRPRVARIARLEREEFLTAWLGEGRAAEMRYLMHHRKARLDPRSRFPWARSLISAA